MPFSAGAREALLKWANTFPLSKTAESLDELSDGIALSEILHDIDPTYDPSDLNKNLGSSKWLTKKRNLLAVYKALFRYIHREYPQLDHQTQLHDFRAIAENPDADGICELLTILVAAALLDEKINHRYIPNLMNKLDPKATFEIQRILEQKQGEIEQAQAAAELDQTIDAGQGDRDPDLEAEEEHIRALSELKAKSQELDRSRKELADLHTRHEYLQMSHDEIKANLERVERELDEYHKLHGASESQKVQALQEKIREQEDLIASQEEQAELDRQTKEQLRLELDDHRKKSSKAEQLEDEVSILRREKEELEKRANMAERYKQKLQNQKDLDKQNSDLRFELESMKEQARDYEKLIAEKARLEAMQKQHMKSLEQSEEALWEVRRQKELLDSEVSQLRMRCAILEDKNMLNEKYIDELKEQLNAVGGAIPAGTPTSNHAPFNLEQELEHSADPTAALTLEISRLRAENNLMRNNMGVSSQNEQLRVDLEIAKQKEEMLQRKYNEIFEKHVVAQEQIESLINHSTSEGDAAYQNLRRTQVETTQKLDQERVKRKDLEAEVKSQARELLSVRTDLGAVEKDSVDALEVLKQTDQLISSSLQSELDAVRKEVRTLQLENDQQKSQLIEALLSKERLRKEMEEETRVTPAPTPTPSSDAAPTANPAELEEALRVSKAKTEKLRDAFKRQKEQLEKADQERYELQRRLKAAQQGSAWAQEKAELDQIIKNLQRENAMISTAWYDLTSRLQSNHVVLQRRQDMPKSWLNKQRQMVNATPRR
ncbi:Girdin [Pleurostoma richardsiae]|uniref:Girdin n=1 Tax=Pleurostoma richardsiae TaxID=41990 RepID=A0AA38R4T4_9PEZI|nr:Girdin [Pleurostoma richardsiae]